MANPLEMSALQLQNSKSVIQAKDAAIQELKERVSYLEAEVGPGILGAGSELGSFWNVRIGVGLLVEVVGELGMGGKAGKKVGKAGKREEKGGKGWEGNQDLESPRRPKKKSWKKPQIPSLSPTISARIWEILNTTVRLRILRWKVPPILIFPGTNFPK